MKLFDIDAIRNPHEPALGGGRADDVADDLLHRGAGAHDRRGIRQSPGQFPPGVFLAAEPGDFIDVAAARIDDARQAMPLGVTDAGITGGKSVVPDENVAEVVAVALYPNDEAVA